MWEQEADDRIRDPINKQKYVDSFKQLKRDEAVIGCWLFKNSSVFTGRFLLGKRTVVPISFVVAFLHTLNNKIFG